MLRDIAREAAARANTHELRNLAEQLENSAAEALEQMNKIDEEKNKALSRVAQAEQAMAILDGLQIAATAGSRIADAMNYLGNKAKGQTSFTTEAEARKYINDLAAEWRAKAQEYQTQKRKLEAKVKEKTKSLFKGPFQSIILKGPDT